jgi:L-ascorbate metabolism protein UlaG (beta-lactamase superfamily)
VSVVELTYNGHSCFLIEGGGARLLIDPFLSGYEQAALSPDQVQADYVLTSHGHGDHLGDSVAIARRTGATTISNFEIASWLEGQGVENRRAMHLGGSYPFRVGCVKLTLAHHGSMLPDGSYGGNPVGFLLTIEGKKIYHACDTALFLDMKLIGEARLDLAILPIGDNSTMGPDDALRAATFLKPKPVIPIHYDAFPVIEQAPIRLGTAGRGRNRRPVPSSTTGGGLQRLNARRQGPTPAMWVPGRLVQSYHNLAEERSGNPRSYANDCADRERDDEGDHPANKHGDDGLAGVKLHRLPNGQHASDQSENPASHGKHPADARNEPQEAKEPRGTRIAEDTHHLGNVGLALKEGGAHKIG